MAEVGRKMPLCSLIPVVLLFIRIIFCYIHGGQGIIKELDVKTKRLILKQNYSYLHEIKKKIAKPTKTYEKRTMTLLQLLTPNLSNNNKKLNFVFICVTNFTITAV